MSVQKDLWKHFQCSYAYQSENNPKAGAYYDEIEWGKLISKTKAIPHLDYKEITYGDFFANYLAKNVPCMFSAGLTASWFSRQLWAGSRDESGASMEETFNFEHLLEVYGDAQVSAVNCDDTEYKEGYGTQDCRDMSFRDYIKYLEANIISRREGSSPASSKENSEYPCLYLKDWHIVRFHKSTNNHKLPYECPIYFQSDWLNELSDEKDFDDYKFCYMGPKGSFTSFHADVYGSYSWSANVVGVKKWYLYPPGKELRFYDSRLKKLNFSMSDPGVEGDDYFEVLQTTGECLFVPSGWHHVVWNLTDAISINHNWFNGANLCYIWSVLQIALKEVEKELEDLQNIPDFHEQCQLVLKANHGMNFEGFFEIIECIMEKRLKSSPSALHTSFDINAILHVINEHCFQDPIVQKNFSARLSIVITKANNIESDFT